ncbi:MAG: hypothetical protein M0Z42_02510 [Actinomycetota bacterium]|nr:hypothetical protein [Actinomycetota bacterium]
MSGKRWVRWSRSSESRAVTRRRRREVAARVEGLLGGLPVVCRFLPSWASTSIAMVEFLDGSLLELTDRAEEGIRLSLVGALAEDSGVWLERARRLPGGRSWLVRFRSLGGQGVTVLAGLRLVGVEAPATIPAPVFPPGDRHA